jgi:GUN4-like
MAGDGMDAEERLHQLELRVGELAVEVERLQATLVLVGDVKRYSRLRDLLTTGDLDGADRETARLLADVLVDDDGDISPRALERCPAAMLQIIDALWNGADRRQGFSVQQRLYSELGGSRDTLAAQDAALFAEFTRTVGWPTATGVGFSLPEQPTEEPTEQLSVPVDAELDGLEQLPAGHLPLRCWASDYGLKAANVFMARLVDVFAA